jgi:hypothetical protein
MNKLLIALLLAASSSAFAGGRPTNPNPPACQQLAEYKIDLARPTEEQQFVGADIVNAKGQLEGATTLEQAIVLAEFRCALKRKPNLNMGDSAKYIIEKSSWGNPEKINATYTKYGKHEQWIYASGNILYIDDGKLTGAQKQE